MSTDRRHRIDMRKRKVKTMRHYYQLTITMKTRLMSEDRKGDM